MSENKSKVYVANLTMETEERDILEVFEKQGKIIEVKIKSKTNEKYAFVQYESEEDANGAVNNLQDISILGNKIRVELAMGDKKDKVCYNCGQVGHFARHCQKENNRDSRYRRHRRSRSRSRSPRRRHRDRDRSRSRSRSPRRRYRSRRDSRSRSPRKYRSRRD